MENTQQRVWTSTVGLITKDLRIVPRLGGNRPPGQVAYLADKITQLSRSPVLYRQCDVGLRDRVEIHG